MRPNLLAVGILLILIGAGLWYYPLTNASYPAVTDAAGTRDVVGRGVPVAAPGEGLQYSASWESSASVTVSVYACGSDKSCSLAGSSSAIVTETGLSGTASWTGHPGQYFAIVSTGGSITIVVSYTEPVFGGILGLSIFVLGWIILILGVGLPGRPTVMAPRIPAQFKTTATTEQKGFVIEEPTPKS